MDHTIFQNLIKMLQVLHNDVPVLFEYRQCNEQMKVTTQVICPERFPKAKDVRPFKLAFVPDKKHAEEEKEVGGVC